jgi:hypothetical protein
MTNKNSSSIVFLNLKKSLVEPLEHISRIGKDSKRFPVELIADIGVQREHSSGDVAQWFAVNSDKIS